MRITIMLSSRGSVAVLLSVVCALLPAQTFAQSSATPLRITVFEGEGAVIDGKHKVDIIVRATEVGASVTFKIPAGAGVTFPGGASQVTIKTDAERYARSGNLSPTGTGGKFDVEVQATYMGQTAVAVVHETNGWTPATTNSAPHKSKAVMWIAIIGAGAAGAALATMRKGGGSGSSSASGSVTAGSPTVGAPQ